MRGDVPAIGFPGFPEASDRKRMTLICKAENKRSVCSIIGVALQNTKKERRKEKKEAWTIDTGCLFFPSKRKESNRKEKREKKRPCLSSSTLAK